MKTNVTDVYSLKANVPLSDLMLLFEHFPSWASEIEHFEIFSHPQENQLTQGFFVKFNLLFFSLIS